MNKVLIGIGILLGSILIVENSVLSTTAYVLIWFSTASSLSILSIIVGFMIGFGIKGMLMKEDDSDNEDEFNF